MLLGLVQDEMNSYFPESELRHGISRKTKDRYLRTLVRNTFTFHLNEIFATIQNEYTDWTNAESISDFSLSQTGSLAEDLQEANPYLMQHEASLALTDKLYTAPIRQAADWANRSGYPVYFYVYEHPFDKDDDKFAKQFLQLYPHSNVVDAAGSTTSRSSNYNTSSLYYKVLPESAK